MTIAQPNTLWIFNETGSATSITDYGSDVANGTLTSASGTITFGTDATWHQDAGLPAHGYLEGINKNDGLGASSHVPRVTRTGSFSNSINNSIMVALGFRVIAIDTSAQCMLFNGPEGNSERGGRMRILDQGATFNVELQCQTAAFSQSLTYSGYTGLSYNTDYKLSMIWDSSTVGAAVLKSKLDSGSVISTTTPSPNWTSDTHTTSPPRLFKADGFDDILGFKGYIYYFAYQRSSTNVWTSTDLGTINANPASAFGTWWPGGSPTPQFSQRIYILP